jgi:DNA-binding transcriptional regulator YhcF (GntR family)
VKIELSSTADVPLYQRIADAVAHAILTGQFVPGQRLPSHLELARSLGVSSLTVCQGYKLLASGRIIRQKPGSGAFVELDAEQRLRGKLGRDLARLWIVLGETDLSRCKRETLFIAANLLDGVRQALLGRQTTFHYTRGLTPEDLTDVRDDDAVLLLTTDGIDPVYLNNLLRRGVPIAAVGFYPKTHGVPRVTYARSQATTLACRHLIALGHSRIGFIGHKTAPGAKVSEKFATYTSLMHEAGLDVRARDVRDVRPDFGKAFVAAQDLIRQDDLPGAFFVDTDYKAMEVISALQMAGLRVPEDVAVVGYDDVPDGETFDPPLTTVHIPRREQGCRAAQLLLNWPTDGSTLDDITLQASLVVRRSCGAAASADIATGFEPRPHGNPNETLAELLEPGHDPSC